MYSTLQNLTKLYNTSENFTKFFKTCHNSTNFTKLYTDIRGHIYNKSIQHFNYRQLDKALQNSTSCDKTLPFYKTVHNDINIYRTLQKLHTKLHHIFTNRQTLYTSLQTLQTQLYNTSQNSTTSYAFLHNSTTFYKTYKTLHNFTKTLPNQTNSTQLYRTFTQCSEIYKILQHFTQLDTTSYTFTQLHKQNKTTHTTCLPIQHNLTQLYNTLHNCTQLYILQNPTQLIQNSTKLYTTIITQNCYTILQHSYKQRFLQDKYTTLHNSTQPCTTFTNLYKTLHNFTHFQNKQTTKTSNNTKLYPTIQHYLNIPTILTRLYIFCKLYNTLDIFANKTSQHFTTKTLQHVTTLHKLAQTYTHMYKIVHNFLQLHSTLHIFVKLQHFTTTSFSQLYTI